MVDPNSVPGENLVGRVAMAIPYAGYFIDYAQTKQGILTLVLIPALFLFVFELGNLFRNISAENREIGSPEEVKEGKGE